MRERLFNLAKELDLCASKASDVLAKEIRRAANDDPEWVVSELVEILKA